MILIQIFGNLVPIAAAKITGASKYGIIFSAIGGIIGIIFLPPLGLFIGIILGAIIGELYKFNDLKKAITAGWGTIIGTMISLMIQIFFSVSIFVYILVKLIR